MCALLLDCAPGDELLFPSFTFVSTVNAFVLRGVRPVFVDIHPDTLNLDEGALEARLTARTKAVVPVHYAGVGCEMAALSFHETKNFVSGEGGALLINDPRFIERAEILREKGTNRSRFFLLRLPFYNDLSEAEQAAVVEAVTEYHP